jgi:alkanesulfonate monooxygenase SsuD/methylene tetrahydromethanopterin reductase-like flavin-dependent oxidoreductase (luciferase family)
MRLGLVSPPGEETQSARQAERHGLFGVLVEAQAPGREMTAAAYAATATEAIRVIVRFNLGSDNPVTLAEDLAVLDNIAGGRLVALADTAGLDAAEAEEDLGLLRAAWSGRFLRHRGSRWRVPAGLRGHVAPGSVSVTPKPAQLEVPVWLTGEAAGALAAGYGLPELATEFGRARAGAIVQPARARLAGGLDEDRALVKGWSQAGCTHLLLEVPSGDLAEISRFLAPEVGMPEFPRIIAESDVPLPWPVGSGRS